MSKDYAEMRAAVLRDLDGLRYEVDPKRSIGWLRLDQPPLNVVSYRGRSQIAAILEAFGEDPQVRVVIIRGANGVYTSGADVKAFPQIERDGMSHLASRWVSGSSWGWHAISELQPRTRCSRWQR